MISTDAPVVDRIRRFDRFYEAILSKAVRAAASEDFSAADVRICSELGWSDRGGSGAWLSYRLDLDPARTCLLFDVLPAEQERLVEAMGVIQRALHRASL